MKCDMMYEPLCKYYKDKEKPCAYGETHSVVCPFIKQDAEWEMKVCCPDKDLALEEGFIQIHGSIAFILKNGNDLWDFDFCPFCGEEITVCGEQRQ